MKAVKIDRYGGPGELYIDDMPIPSVGKGHVLIKCAYASVNPADWKIREGLLSSTHAYSFPLILGMDAAGLVEAVGEGVTEFRPGDRVLTMSSMPLGKNGTYAEYCLVDAPRVAHLPEGLSLVEGAVVPTAAASAAASILDVAQVKSGDRVLVNGGAGGVGSFAIPFLKYLGAEVAATCSTQNVDYVRNLGASCVIDYTRDNLCELVGAWAPDGLDHIIDAVGLGTLPANAPRLIRLGGTLVCIANLISGPADFDLELASRRKVRVLDNIRDVEYPDPVYGQVRAFRQILAAIAKGAVPIPKFQVLPLQDVAKAHLVSASGPSRGKIALAICPDLETAHSGSN